MFIEKDGTISPVITFAPALVVLFRVMCPGELIILKETKAILFPVSQDANLFWLVILLWGLFAAARSIKAPLKCSLPSPRPSCLRMCKSDSLIPQKNPFKCFLGGLTIDDLARFQATCCPAEMFVSGRYVEWIGSAWQTLNWGKFSPNATGYNVNAHTFIACSWCSSKFGFEENNIVHCWGYYLGYV